MIIEDRGSTQHAGDRGESPYRADIDGLRAVAVSCFIAFHFGLWKFAHGGFVGVDVFFVISGYLITRTLFPRNEQDAPRSSTGILVAFYARRARRILPAGVAMILACLAAAVLLLFPGETEDVGNAASAAALFVANIHFESLAGYFDRRMEVSPLLHMWSLAVEEQFYLAFPLLMIAIRRVPTKWRVALLALLAGASLLATIVVQRSDPSAAFYLPHLRAWELLIGALLAVGALPALRSRALAAATCVGGILAILASALLTTRYMAFPGLLALPPCLGAAAVIHSGTAHMSWPNRMLGWAPMRAIGLISYSLYLWHWPLLVFLRLDHEPETFEKIGLVLASIALAALSWRFVERPFRSRPHRLGPQPTIAIGLSAVIATALLGQFAEPVAKRLRPVDVRTARILAMLNYRTTPLRGGVCFIPGNRPQLTLHDETCLKLVPQRRNVLIVGDSHAAHLWPGFSAAYPDVNFLQATASGCKPVIGDHGARGCTALFERIYGDFVGRAKLDAIIISARWLPRDVERAANTARFLSGKVPNIYVMGPIVEYDGPLPRILARAPRDAEAPAAARHRRTASRDTDRLFAARLSRSPATYISVHDIMCPRGAPCLLWTAPDTPIQFDYGHLTVQGATLVAACLRNRLSFGRPEGPYAATGAIPSACPKPQKH